LSARIPELEYLEFSSPPKWRNSALSVAFWRAQPGMRQRKGKPPRGNPSNLTWGADDKRFTPNPDATCPAIRIQKQEFGDGSKRFLLSSKRIFFLTTLVALNFNVPVVESCFLRDR
jgi:hypothetical protein